MASLFAPETPTEARILNDPYFQQAIRLGRPRQGHPEGVLGVHIQHILAAIDRLDRPELRPILRLAAMLHDLGKFASLSHIAGYQPEHLPKEELAALIKTSEEFRDEFQYAPQDADHFVPEHCLYSWRFAMRFTDDPVLLDLIRYHDTGWKLSERWERESLDDSLLRKYYGGKDAALYVIFSYVDAASREKDIPLWMQRQLLRVGLLREPVIPGA